MTAENDRFKKMIEILRNSKPQLVQPEEIENEVINRIRRESQKAGMIPGFIESLFGWVYISWVRRSLIGAAVILVAVFLYQQAFIFKQVKNISKQAVITGNEISPFSSSEFDKKITLYKISNRFSTGGEIKIPESRLRELLDSYNEIQLKYKDLLRVIEEDPELKKYIENKLDAEKKYKPDI